MKIDFDFDDAGFSRMIEDYARKAPDEIKATVAESAEMITSQAKALAPVAMVNGGTLKNSISVSYYNSAMSAEIGTPVTYAIFVEMGTRYQSAQPYLFPSYEMERPKYMKALEKALRL
ncbi:HK97 gp10 family phage protein [Virgibacillus sp. C22-A2]|uniref:HK97 gp10 family phage protein n=1 Tax=Virgibacillus tibetensis TaxID=3042313 RepID=A0ABU6KAH2_9BACI|nr:HK97 gp10 family phage protein [Virgibacillus sp. C22-A2]